MKLISCHIDHFGRLQNFDFTFSDGLNPVLRENGWGKTTFAAFLCAMFYGFPAARRRGVSAEERERYRPWQGGTYGGSLLFSSGGTVYEMTRSFGSREAEDLFELRDVDTNLPDFRFSSRIGEELFALDRESFRRTAFIRQLDCGTRTTDTISALLADLSGQEGDLGSYEEAMKRLTGAANRLSPKRRTGSLYRRAEEIRLLERETADAGDLAAQISREEARQREETIRETELADRLRGLEEELEKARLAVEKRALAGEKASGSAARQEVLRRLRKTVQARQENALKAAEAFPGRIPERQEVDECLRKCRELERLEYSMQENMLSGEEQRRLTELEKEFALAEPEKGFAPAEAEKEYAPAEAETEFGPAEPENEFEPAEQEQPFLFSRKESREKERAGWKACFAAGLMLLCAGLFAACGMHAAAGGAAAAAGLVLCALSAAGSVLSGRRPGEDRNPGNRPGEDRNPGNRSGGERKPGNRGRGDRIARPGEGDRTAAAEYAYLQKKEQKLEEIHARWAEARRPVVSFLREIGFSPEEDLRSQLERIRDAADAYEDAQDLLREAGRELRSAEEEAGEQPGARSGALSGTLPGERDAFFPEEKPDAAGLRILREQADETREALLQCRKEIADRGLLLEELQAELEDREAAAARLQTLRAGQEQEEILYSRITKAAVLLQKARDSLTGRYADPVRRSFSRYWEAVTGTSAAGVYVDSNAKVTVQERGRQREIERFSTGFRDLAGICLRIALVDAMYPQPAAERPPLILDDPFANIDDEKMPGAMRLLKEAAEKNQILYFTCSRSRCGELRAGARRYE